VGHPDQRWVLVDASPPGVVAATADGRVVRPLDEVLVLPEDGDPVVWISQAGVRWTIEFADRQVRTATDGEQVQVGELSWEILLPRGDGGSPIPSTVGFSVGPILDDVGLIFGPNEDQSFVQVSWTWQGETHPLPPRACHQLLLLLAHARLEDRHSGRPEAECGWMPSEELRARLGASPQKFHVDSLRCRRQLGALGIRDADDLFGRRSTTRELRLAINRLQILEPGEASAS